MANLFDYRFVLSPRAPVQKYIVLSGVTVATGDVVKIDVATGHVELVAADGTQMLGWALAGVTGDGTETIPVLLALPGVQVHMPIVSGTTYAATMNGQHYSLEGSTGAFTAGLADTGHDLLKAVCQGKTTGYAWVTCIPTCSEAFTVEPI